MTSSVVADALFRPAAIALVGASSDPSKNNSRPQRYLRKTGYAGTLLPINPNNAEVLGERAYPSLSSVPGPVDHAFVMVPAAAVPGVIEECCAKKVKVATIFSAGFAELGVEGHALQRRALETARAGGVRLLGPNCLGVINVTDNLPLTVNAVIEEEAPRPGTTGVVSQSGSMLGSLLSRASARGLGFSKMVSVGNECDLSVGEIAGLMLRDADTRVVALFLETLRDSRALAEAARLGHELGKPLIAFKLGRSSIARQVAASHTGAMVGPDELTSAFLRENGILRVDTLEGLLELPQLIAGHRPPRGRRVAMMTATGGAAAMIVDRLGVLGDEIVPPTPALQESLAAQGIELSGAPLTDVTMAVGHGERYTRILSSLLHSDHCDAVVAVMGSTARARPAVIADRVLAAVAEAGPDVGKPLAVFLAPQADIGLSLLRESGVAGFRTPESCADAVHAFLHWQAPRAPQDGPSDRSRLAEQLMAEAGPGALTEVQALSVFAALGMPVTDCRMITRPEEADGVVGTVALKLVSADILHKTEAGLVLLNVSGPAAIREGVAQLLEAGHRRHPHARIEGVAVQPMERGLAELIVGYKHDPEVGPIVVVGIGGIFAELRPSVAIRLAPVSHDDAAAMLMEVPELGMLRGFRGLPLGDLRAVARAVAALSDLARFEHVRVREAEINPLIVRADGDGVVAVDGLLVLQ